MAEGKGGRIVNGGYGLQNGLWGKALLRIFCPTPARAPASCCDPRHTDPAVCRKISDGVLPVCGGNAFSCGRSQTRLFLILRCERQQKLSLRPLVFRSELMSNDYIRNLPFSMTFSFSNQISKSIPTQSM